MNGDGRWRIQCVNPTSSRPFVVWRIAGGVTEYHRSTPTNYAPNGRIVRYRHQAARDKVRELNTGDIQGDGRAPGNVENAVPSDREMSEAGDTVNR